MAEPVATTTVTDGEGGLPALEPGRVVGLEGPPGTGLTRLGFTLLAVPALTTPVVALDVRGWLSPLAAWEAGVPPDRLVVVRCPDRSLWPQVTAALLEGMGAVFAEVPPGVGEQQLRRLTALNRARRGALVLRPLQGELPPGISSLRLRVSAGAKWEGVDQGRGRLRTGHLRIDIAGKGIRPQSLQVAV
jgi:hypothetical protein